MHSFSFLLVELITKICVRDVRFLWYRKRPFSKGLLFDSELGVGFGTLLNVLTGYIMG